MQTTASVPPFAPDAPTMGDGAAAWTALCESLRQRARLDAKIVELTGIVQRSGTIERLEGVPLDTALNLVHRMPRADRSMQLTAADVLATMPQTQQLFADGMLSWGQVRGIVVEARGLSKADRALLDEHVGASADRFAKFDPGDAIDAVRIVAAEIRGARKAEKDEERVARANFVWGQPAMFGPAKLYSELDNLSLAAVMDSIDAMAPTDDGRPLSQRRADGLVNLALHRCDADAADSAPTGAGETGDEGDPPPDAGADDPHAGAPPADRQTPATGGATRTCHPRLNRATPAYTVLVDLRDVTMTAAGMVHLNAPGCIPTVTAAALEALATDASVRVVLMDGGRPLAVTKKVWAKQVPADVRLAVKARDRGDRFPGSRRRIEHLHHLDKDGAGHHPDTVLGMAERSHRRVHRFGWSISINPTNGEATFTRGERSWTTLPKGTRLRRPPPRPG